MTNLSNNEVRLFSLYVAVGTFCERRGNKKNGKHHDGNARPHRETVIEKALKSKIYIHLHFFLQFIYNEPQYGCVGLICEGKTIFAYEPFQQTLITYE